MSLTNELRETAAGCLIVLGGLLMLVDTMWGALFVLPFDWSQLVDIVLGISVVLGLPAYILDLKIKKRVLVFLPALFVVRWIAGSYVTTPPTFGHPWRGNELLIPAALLLQWAKLRNPESDVA